MGFVDIAIGTPIDTFEGAGGERNARAFEVYGYAFLARRPDDLRHCVVVSGSEQVEELSR